MKNLTFLRSLFVLSALLIAGVGYAQISRDISKLKSLSPGKIIKLDKKAELADGSRSRSQTMKKSGELRNDTVVFFHESFGNGDVGEGLEINSYSGYDSFNNGLGITGNGMIYGSGNNNYAWLPKTTKNEEDGKYYINGFIDFDGIDFGSYSKVLLQFNIAKTGNNANIGIYTSNNGGTLSFDLPETNIFYIANPIDITNILSNENTLLELACTDMDDATSNGIFIDEITLLGVNLVQEPQNPDPQFAEYALASDSESLIFEHSPYYPWSIGQVIYNNGLEVVNCVNSTNQGMANSNSWFSTTVTSDKYIDLSFDWMVSSEDCCDRLIFYINDEEYAQAENGDIFRNQSLLLAPGTYFLKWSYSKNRGIDNGSDCGYVRNLKVAYTSAIPEIGVLFKETFGTVDVSAVHPKVKTYTGYDYYGQVLYESMNGIADIRSLASDTIRKNHLWLPAQTMDDFSIYGLKQFTEGHSNLRLSFDVAVGTEGNLSLSALSIVYGNEYTGYEEIELSGELEKQNAYRTMELDLPDNCDVINFGVMDETNTIGYRVDNITITEKGSSVVDVGTVATEEFISAVLSSESIPLTFKTSSLYPWQVMQGETSINPIPYVMSSNQGIANSKSWFSTIVTNYSDFIDLSFDWRASGEIDNDYLVLYVNDMEFGRATSAEYLNMGYRLNPGSYTLKWVYTKNASVDEGEDYGAVRNLKVSYSPYVAPAFLELSKDMVNFGNTNTPEIAKDTVLISNQGGEDLTITSVSEVTAPFGRSTLTQNTFGQGTGENINFTFTPKAEDKGLFTQTVTIESNGGQRQITLKGYANMGNVIEVPEYGRLSSVVADTSVDSLVIAGYLNESDFMFMRDNMPNLRYVDMSMATVLGNEIPNYAFHEKQSLEEVILPATLNTISYYAFENCISLEIVILPEGLTNIYDYAFRYCSSLTGELLLPSTLQSIGYYAFEGAGYTVCRSKAVTPPSVNSGGLGNISLVYVPKGSAQAYRNNYPWSEMTIIDGDSMTEVSVTLTEAGTLGAEILKQAESVAVVNKLTIAGPLNTTDWNLIRNSMSSLVSIDLSACTVTSIPNSQFSDKSSLLEVVLPNDLKIIEYDAFLRCTKLTEIIIPESVTSIGDNAFNGCTLLGKINIPINLRSLGQSAFYGCTVLQSPIVIPEGITEIPYDAFYNCRALSEVTLPESLLSIRNRAFYRCAIKNIVLPSRLITLESDVFNSCPLEEIKLPAILSTIGSSALNCSTLRKIICQQATPPVLNSDPFSNVDKTTCELSVPAWSVDMYKLAKYWMNFSNITTYEASVDYLPISGIFTMADGIRPQGLPSVTVQQGATLIVRGDQPFATNQFMMNHKLYNSWGSNFSSSSFANLINESPEMTAESVAMNLNVNGNRWFFLSFPYDINYSDITIDEGKFFVFRKYDGTSRAQKGTSTVTGDSWKNIEPTETLKAGNGYIFQCSADVTNLVLKATMESKNQLFANTMRAIALNDHIPADGNTENQSWNLVGNPFPSYFNMNNIEYVTPITIWNGSSYEALSPVDDEYVLRPFEAFFVQKPTDVALIKFNPEGRIYQNSTSNKVAPKKAATNSDRKVFNFIISNGSNTDKCRIVLNPKAKADYEMTCDAAKFMSLDTDVPQIYTMDRKGTTFAINERPEGNVMMGMYAGNAGNYTISLQTQVEGVNVFLLDRTTGEETDLTTQDYTFNASEGMDNNRFEVRFETPGATGIDAENAVPVKVSVVKGTLNVQAAAGSTIEVIDYAGLTVKRVNTMDTVTEIVLPQGAYIVVVNGKSYKAMLL